MSQKDPYGRHELLDRACLLTKIIDDFFEGHDGLEAVEKELVDSIRNQAGMLYQIIGGTNAISPKPEEEILQALRDQIKYSGQPNKIHISAADVLDKYGDQ